MNCKRHNHEDGPGVCASCLRERLFALATIWVDHSPVNTPSLELPPQPLPLSLQPFAASSPWCLRSDASASSAIETKASSAEDGCRTGTTKFSILSTLFSRHQHRHHNYKSDEAKLGAERPNPPSSSDTAPGSVHGHRNRIKSKKKISRLFSADDAAVAASPSRRSCRRRERGLSPERGHGGSLPESGYTTESPGDRWRHQHPSPSPARRETAEHNHYGRGLSAFTVCLSPLVRPGGLNRRRFHGAGIGLSGNLQGSLSPCHRRQAAGGEAALYPNRSRKLADQGKFR